jgi:hypothetical protein
MSDGQKSINDFFVNFARPCQGHTLTARIKAGTPSDSQRNENGKRQLGKKIISDFYVNFDRNCQDRIFAARIQIWDPK